MAHVRPPLRSADLSPRRTWYVGAVAAADTKSNVGATRQALSGGAASGAGFRKLARHRRAPQEKGETTWLAKPKI